MKKFKMISKKNGKSIKSGNYQIEQDAKKNYLSKPR